MEEDKKEPKMASSSNSLPILGASIMVKNEEKYILRTLRSILKFGIKLIIVYDTGSTDQTVQVIEYFCSRNFLRLKLLRGGPREGERFVFSHQRNILLKFCNGLCENVLLLDTDDEILGNYEGLESFLAQNDDCSTFMTKMVITGSKHHQFYRARIVETGNPHIMYEGDPHENIITTKPGVYKTTRIPHQLLIVYQNRAVGKDSTPRMDEDIAKLKETIAKGVDPETAYFYLGQSYATNGQYPEAISAYKKRIECGLKKREDSEGMFLTYYRLGNLIGGTQPDSWEKAEKYFLRAYNHRQRAEPLYRIAGYYFSKKEYIKGYEYAKRMCLECSPPNEKSEDICCYEEPMVYIARWKVFADFCVQILQTNENIHPVEKDKLQTEFKMAFYIYNLLREQNTLENERVKPFLFLGHPRCGTGFAAHIFSKFTLKIGHEIMGKDGVSCWVYAVDGETVFDWIKHPREYYKFENTIHVIRDPFTAIPSIAFTETLTSEPEDKNLKNRWLSTQFRERILKIPDESSLVERATLSFLGWNELIEKQKPGAVFRIEHYEEDMKKIMPEQKVFPTSDEKINSRDHPKGDDLWAQLSEDLRTKLDDFCIKHGYPTITSRMKSILFEK